MDIKSLIKPILNFIISPTLLEQAKKDIVYLKALVAYWKIYAGINLAVYFKNSIGRGSTYCNITVYDILDVQCNAVWNVLVQIGASHKWKYPMGQSIYAFDFDIRPIMPNGDYNKILSAPIPKVHKLALNAAKKGLVRKLTWKEAQELANAGIPSIIISTKINHVAITAPNFQWDGISKKWKLLPYDSDIGVYTGNPGDVNSMMYMNDSRGFGKFNWKKDADVFELPDRKTGQFLSQMDN